MNFMSKYGKRRDKVEKYITFYDVTFYHRIACISTAIMIFVCLPASKKCKHVHSTCIFKNFTKPFLVIIVVNCEVVVSNEMEAHFELHRYLLDATSLTYLL